MAHQRPVKQKRLLKAIKKIYKDYQKHQHMLDIDDCPLCVIYMTNDGWVNNCSDCPMTVFRGSQSCKCMNRKCRPVNCNEKEDRHKVPLVTEFYRRFVVAVEGMTDAEVQAKNAFKFLKTLDNRVYKKYS